MVEKEVLAVYGTLRKGRGNHFFLEGQEFVGYGILRSHVFCEGHLTIKETGDSGDFVIVEVYRVDKDILEGPIDSLEGYPYFYNRKKVIVDLIDQDYENFLAKVRDDLENLKPNYIEAWVYYVPDSPCPKKVSSYISSERGL